VLLVAGWARAAGGGDHGDDAAATTAMTRENAGRSHY